MRLISLTDVSIGLLTLCKLHFLHIVSEIESFQSITCLPENANVLLPRYSIHIIGDKKHSEILQLCLPLYTSVVYGFIFSWKTSFEAEDNPTKKYQSRISSIYIVCYKYRLWQFLEI